MEERRPTPKRKRRKRRRGPPIAVILIVLVLVLVGVGFLINGIFFAHEHIPAETPDCTVDLYCSECDRLIWAAHEHTPGPAATACNDPQRCKQCDMILSAIPHTPGEEATCSTPQLCTVCGEVVVEAVDHIADLTQNCGMPQICKFCGITIGDPVGHNYTESEDGLQKTCGSCGQILNLTSSTVDQTIIPETANTGHYNNDIDAYYSGSILICGDYGLEYFPTDPTGSTGYAQLTSEFAGKYPNLNVSSLLVPKACAFYEPAGYDSVLEDQASYIATTYGMMEGVTTVDAMSLFRKHTGEYLYYRTDHHWTSLGAYYAFAAFCEANGITPRPLSSYQTVVNCGSIGSLYNFSGNNSALTQNPDYSVAHLPNTEYTMTCTTADGYTFEATALNTDTSSYAGMFISGDLPFTHIVTENKNGRKILVVKESYGNAFVPYLIDCYEEIIAIDMREQTDTVEHIIEQYGITDALIINNVQSATGQRDILRAKLMS